jgi:hypothetical protein
MTEDNNLEKTDAVADKDWQTSLGLPDEDTLRRDWSRYDRKLSYIYPEVILPSWRRKNNL